MSQKLPEMPRYHIFSQTAPPQKTGQSVGRPENSSVTAQIVAVDLGRLFCFILCYPFTNATTRGILRLQIHIVSHLV
ncbi:MAG: hypothetical protein RR807_09520, partial [Oscillospiraceae bacterium]